MTPPHVQSSECGHRLGGSPNFTQVDPREVEGTHVQLLHLSSDDDLELMWGEVGTAHFLIQGLEPALDTGCADRLELE
ncbi:DUF1963 domain-containing protein [Deinococcus marmoris]|uniref:DUF1963 domain-containing protein n=1 Tax=Deinococcus marmoris TaxID=249408 RepID=UPI0009E01489|nr:DUF1963 domain-containing protein [Deinococcus marmoris]